MMKQNFSCTEAKAPAPMSKADICRELYNAAEFHLFGDGSWPADKEASVVFWKMLDDWGLTKVLPGELRAIRYTALGMELNVELMSIFAGVMEHWDVPLVLDLMGYLDDDEADAIYAASSEQVMRQHVREVYFKFCNRTRYLN